MKTAAARYAALRTSRESVLDRARRASQLTIPGLVPEEGQDEHTVLENVWQSLGARGVKMLSARLILALFPPNLPFFRLAIDPAAAKAGNADPEKANVMLAEMSSTVHAMMEAANIRQCMTNTSQHLVVAGNYLLNQPEKKRTKGFRIDQYVVKRNAEGEFTLIIVHEKVHASTLPDDVREVCKINEKIAEKDLEKPIDVYTVVERQDDKIVEWQEINGIEVPASRAQSPAEYSPWMPLRWEEVPGSDYGRSLVSIYEGDLLTLERHAQSMAEANALASRVIWLVDPSSQTDIEELAAAPSGSYVQGSSDDVASLQLDKGQDLSIAMQHGESIARRLSAAFLIQDFRQAERVTAEEIRANAEELETALGGTYSVLSSELQRPLIQRWLWIAERQKKIAGMSKTKDKWAIKLITGMDALGRASEANRLRAWLADIVQLPGAAESLNMGAIASRFGLAHGVEDLASLIKSPDQQAAEAEQAQAQQVASAAVPQIAKIAGEQMLTEQQ